MRAADQYTYSRRNGEITDVQTYDAGPKDTKVKSAVYSSWGGLFTRILTFLAALIGSTLPPTGYWLWLRCQSAKSKHKAMKAPEPSQG